MRDPLFFFGSLRDADLFAIVAGRPLGDFAVTAAVLVDRRAERAENEAYPVLVEAPGARAEGILVHGLDPEIVARIAFYETTDYVLGPVEVVAGGEPVAAHCFHATEILPSSGEWWCIDHWSRAGKPLALHAAELAMGHYGRVSHEDVAAVWPEIYREAARRLAAAERLSA
ncbi:gamma-glutamylcyclotransferase family protein [Prosthecomicrobium sp. N25]|uniref:gamma-glutamylcyclotransferase family protein n=1 Tax=Prosthecomicrobium sp. N25 TaxID=3129254 RepID=UPI0030775A48